MDPRVIKTEAQYEAYLAEAQKLIVLDPAAGTAEGDRLELLALLVEKYERDRFPIEAPDPIDAIVFRMNEQGLHQKDLIPFIGSKGRVSEILNRKRPLTVNMIRALSTGLGIPAEVLLAQQAEVESKEPPFDWRLFPVKDMKARGWLQARADEPMEAAVKRFFAQLGLRNEPAALFSRSFAGNATGPSVKFALLAWVTRVLIRARAVKKNVGAFGPGKVSADLLREVAQLSWSERGPLLAQEYLAKHGIVLVLEPHLPSTRLDGAAMVDEDGTPVIALTVRYDRLDNYWFTLLHELAHLHKHLRQPSMTFVDDVELEDSTDPLEVEANRIARDAFVPRTIWKRSDAYRHQTVEAILKLAQEQKIHPAVVAGRIRRETKNFRVLNQLLGQGCVRRLFPQVNWS
jgi:HTH-type transcriptional regulator/antitoxin HigA